jgi:ribosome biogenesis GTPase / thiamine phosphate phosphatase
VTRADPTGPGPDDLGWDERWAARAAAAADGADGLEPARVVRHDGVALLLGTAAGDLTQVPLSPTLDPPPVVGDWVLHDEVTVRAVLPRDSLRRRRSARGELEQPVAANVDTVLVVHGGDRPSSPERVQRFAALAWDAGAEPVLVLSKADLVDDPQAAVELLLAGSPQMTAVVTSVGDRRGVDELRRLTSGRTMVLVGESGSGKSTLVNVLVGDAVAVVGDVRTGDRKGRHTTTARQLHVLPGGGCLIDTPGVRAVGLWVDPEAVAEAFTDLDELSAQCRFADCGHGNEPGCAIRAGVEAGELDAGRVASWRNLIDEVEEVERHVEETARRRRGRRR